MTPGFATVESYTEANADSQPSITQTPQMVSTFKLVNYVVIKYFSV